MYYYVIYAYRDCSRKDTVCICVLWDLLFDYYQTISRYVVYANIWHKLNYSKLDFFGFSFTSCVLCYMCECVFVVSMLKFDLRNNINLSRTMRNEDKNNKYAIQIYIHFLLYNNWTHNCINPRTNDVDNLSMLQHY